MLKTLSLIGMMFVGGLFAAGEAALSNDLDTQLQHTHRRATCAATFGTMAAQSAVAVDDEARCVFNTDLAARFTAMEAELGVSPLLTLHTIETVENARNALDYYTGAKETLLALMRTLTEQHDTAQEDVE